MNAIAYLTSRRLILVFVSFGVLSFMFSACSVMTVLSAQARAVTRKRNIGLLAAWTLATAPRR